MAMDPTVKKILLIVIGALIFLFLIEWVNAADLPKPKYENLIFTDMADLDRQCDSILAVCDTTWVLKNDIWFSTDSRGNVQYVPYDSIHPDRKIPVITCRRFAGLTIMWMPGLMAVHGTARLWWWEVKP